MMKKFSYVNLKADYNGLKSYVDEAFMTQHAIKFSKIDVISRKIIGALIEIFTFFVNFSKKMWCWSRAILSFLQYCSEQTLSNSVYHLYKAFEALSITIFQENLFFIYTRIILWLKYYSSWALNC